MSSAVTPPPLSPLAKLLRYLKNSFANGRSPALWLLALVVGVVAGYAAIGLRLAIQSVQLIAFGEFPERLATTASTLPPLLIILAPVAGGCVVSLLLYVGLRTKWLPEVRAEGVADVMAPSKPARRPGQPLHVLMRLSADLMPAPPAGDYRAEDCFQAGASKAPAARI